MTSKQQAYIWDGTQYFYFDTHMRESHSSDINLTDNGAELGVLLTDHAYLNPDVLVLDVLVGETISKIYEPNQYTLEDRSQHASQIFKKILSDVNLLTVGTIQKIYTNMVLKSITNERTSKNADTWEATLTFREIRLAGLNIVQYKGKYGNPKRTSGNAARPNDSLGTRAKTGVAK